MFLRSLAIIARVEQDGTCPEDIRKWDANVRASYIFIYFFTITVFCCNIFLASPCNDVSAHCVYIYIYIYMNIYIYIHIYIYIIDIYIYICANLPSNINHSQTIPNSEWRQPGSRNVFRTLYGKTNAQSAPCQSL